MLLLSLRIIDISLHDEDSNDDFPMFISFVYIYKTNFAAFRGFGGKPALFEKLRNLDYSSMSIHSNVNTRVESLLGGSQYSAGMN
jgi:hypothetical protein